MLYTFLNFNNITNIALLMLIGWSQHSKQTSFDKKTPFTLVHSLKKLEYETICTNQDVFYRFRCCSLNCEHPWVPLRHLLASTIPLISMIYLPTLQLKILVCATFNKSKKKINKNPQNLEHTEHIIYYTTLKSLKSFLTQFWNHYSTDKSGRR